MSREVLSHQFDAPRTGELHEPHVTAHVSQFQPGHYYLRNLSVSPDYRGQGIGTRFMHHLIREHDRAHTSLTLHTARPELVHWYGAMGFQSEGEDLFGTRMTRAPR